MCAVAHRTNSALAIEVEHLPFEFNLERTENGVKK